MIATPLPRVYPIVPDASWVARLLPLGVKWVQLRIKDSDTPRLRTEISSAHAACRRAGASLVVNDYWELALELQCEWVHLGQQDLDSADLPALRRAGIRFGLSSHDHQELDRALSLAPDYIALGPIYPTLLKQMPWAPQGLARLTEWKRRLGNRSLVAIGGLTVERLAAVYQAGADSAAVVTDIVRHADPERRTREWLVEGARTASLAARSADLA